MVNREQVLDELRQILDPEMPVNLVDLGLIERIEIAAAHSSTEPIPSTSGERVAIDVLPTFVGCPALDMIRGLIQQRVGGLAGVGEVQVRFLHDPPWSTDRISLAGREALRQHGVTTPAVGAASGSQRLVPLTVPTSSAARPPGMNDASGPADCPFCGATETKLESRFGPTRCRMIYYCPACRNSFEHLKPI